MGGYTAANIDAASVCITQSCPSINQGISGQLFSQLITTLVSTQCALAPIEQYTRNYSPHLKNEDEFDFIIIGGGTAGSVVANRLSENPEWNVLLLEAGGVPSVTSEIPAYFDMLQYTHEDWQFKFNTNGLACKAMQNNQCAFPRGKMLGGTSGINYLQYARGTEYDYEQWLSKGNTQWGYASVFPYFLKSENMISDEKNTLLHGSGGYLTTDYMASEQPMRNVIINAASALGHQFHNDEELLGYFEMLTTIENGARLSSSKAFLAKIKNRPNLKIARNAHVEKVLINADKRAYGVQVKVGRRVLTVTAKNDVILSAGVVGSPQLLILSGVGPEDQLTKFNIPTVANSNVGFNLQDHVAYYGILVKLPVSSFPEGPSLMDALFQWFMHRTGPLASIDLFNLVGKINTKGDTTHPNILYYHFMYNVGDEEFVRQGLKILNYKQDYAEQIVAANKDHVLLYIIPSLLTPKSIGRISLYDTSPYSKPIVDSNFLSDTNDDDITTLVESIRYVEQLLAQESFASYNPEIIKLTCTECDELTDGSDDYWKCMIRYFSSTFHSPVGTCKMGPADDTDAVVDEDTLKVRGVTNLRVIDGSVMPQVIGAPVAAATIMIGERGSDFIKKEYGFTE